MLQRLGPFLVLTTVFWLVVVQAPALFYGTTTAKREAHARIRAGEPLLDFSLTEQEFEQFAVPGNELLMDGVLHDIVSCQKEGNRIRIRAFRDDRETFVAKRLRKMFQRRPDSSQEIPQWVQTAWSIKFLVAEPWVLQLLEPSPDPKPRIRIAESLLFRPRGVEELPPASAIRL